MTDGLSLLGAFGKNEVCHFLDTPAPPTSNNQRATTCSNNNNNNTQVGGTLSMRPTRHERLRDGHSDGHKVVKDQDMPGVRGRPKKCARVTDMQCVYPDLIAYAQIASQGLPTNTELRVCTFRAIRPLMVISGCDISTPSVLVRNQTEKLHNRSMLAF